MALKASSIDRIRAHSSGPLLLIALLFSTALDASSQELEPQRWRHLPVDTNFVTASYIHLDADIALDPVLGIEDATSSVDTWALAYMRTFELFGHSAQVRILQPFQDGSWEGSLTGMPVAVERQGLADTEVRFAVHLFGAPPLKGREYGAYRASSRVHTTGGLALAIQLPTGEYNDKKLINLGTNQYVFRPEIGIVHDRGNWSFEASAIASFYTDNESYFGGNELELAPLWFAQANMLYRFRPDLWAAVGVGYAIGAESTVNGVDNGDRRENILLGASVGYSVVPWLGITLKYIRSENQVEIGTSSDRYIASLSTFW
ncbi:MAG: transporter [Dongiaceae bacterium]